MAKPIIPAEIDEINSKITNDEANYNASNILTKIKTIDGSNSGLDADTIDGKDSTAFVLTTAINLVPTGAVMSFAMATVPNGWLKCNGSAISRTTYNNLFTAIGTIYGVGDGSTTFNLLDLRGYFVRGFDDARGVDTGRIFGSGEADTFASHTHNENSEVWMNNGGSKYITPGTGSNWMNTESVGTRGSAPTGSNGGTETRPKNIALMYCIKY